MPGKNIFPIPHHQSYQEGREGKESTGLTLCTRSFVEETLDGEKEINFQNLIGFFEQTHPAIICEFFEKPEHIKEILFPFLDFLRHTFFSKSNPIPEKIMRSFRNDLPICAGVFSYIKERNGPIQSIQYAEQYDIIAFHFFLLGIGEDFDLTKDIQSNQLHEINSFLLASILDISEALGSEKMWNCADFSRDITNNALSRVLRIVETMNVLALIHSGNFEERQISIHLDSIIRTNIDALLGKMGSKFTENHPMGKKMDNLCGQVQVNFGHAVPIDGETVSEVKRQVAQGIKQLRDGLARQRKSQLGGEPSKEEYCTKIEGANEALLELIGFEKIKKINGSLSSEELKGKMACLEKLIDIYNYAVKQNFSTTEEILEDIHLHGIKNEFQIEALYYLILHNTDIKEDSLERIMNFFLNNERQINNYFHEQMGIKITAQIVRRFHTSEQRFAFLPIIERIRASIRKKDISHSVLSYSKVYLSLALYYIECRDEKYREYAQRCFLHYKNLSTPLIGADKNLKNFQDERNFYTTLGSMDEMKRYGKQVHTNEDLEKSGIYIFEEAMDRYRQSAIVSIEAKVGRIISSMNTKDDVLTQEQINDLFGKEVAEAIFYNLCTITIIGDCENCITKKDNAIYEAVKGSAEMKTEICPETVTKRGFQRKHIPIVGGIFITFIYPSVSEKIFEKIFSEHYALIQERFGNLIAINKKNVILQESKKELEKLAFYDTETGLPNKNRLKEDIEKMEQGGGVPTILLIEVPDHSMIINTVDGEKAWSERIRQTLEALHELEDVTNVSMGKIYRRDDSTFAIVSDQPKDLLEAFINALPEGSFAFYMGMVVGESKDILSKAGIALSKARKARQSNGDSTIQYFEIGDQEKLNKLNDNTNVLQQALDGKNPSLQMVPHYQPICDVNGSIIKYEALARIEKKEKDGKTTIIFPVNFIDIAEDNGWSHKVTTLMLKGIEEDLKRDPNMNVSVNIDAQSWNNERVDQKLRDFNFQKMTHRITLEILETVRLSRKEDEEKIKNLREMGFAWAVDDYGTGHSHGIRVAKVKPENLKIDEVLVKMLWNNETREDGIKLIQEAVSTAYRFGAKTIAEFVKDKAVLDILIDCGVDYFQGEYFSMAKPFNELVQS